MKQMEPTCNFLVSEFVDKNLERFQLLVRRDVQEFDQAIIRRVVDRSAKVVNPPMDELD